MELGPGYAKSAPRQRPASVVCIDSLHVAKLGAHWTRFAASTGTSCAR